MEAEPSGQVLHIKQTGQVTFVNFGAEPRLNRIVALGLRETGWPGVIEGTMDAMNRFPENVIANSRVEVRNDSLREAVRARMARARGVPIDQVQIDPPPVFTPREKVYTMH